MSASHVRRPSKRQSSAIFDLPSSDSSDSGDDDTPLPFPSALPRSDFLAPDFQPAEYLSALPTRHQTLEDLRSDLRDRSAAISAELLELVNSNYTVFLSLGSELQGGDDKVEDVKVALLGFRRAVEEVKAKVASRRLQTETLTTELQQVRSDIEQGRKFLEADERISCLEKRLAIDSLPTKLGGITLDTDDEDEDADEDGHVGLLGSSPTKLLVSVQQYSRAKVILDALDAELPLVVRLAARLMKCRNTLLLDLSNALREARKSGPKGRNRILRYLALYRMLDASAEGLKAIRQT